MVRKIPAMAVVVAVVGGFSSGAKVMEKARKAAVEKEPHVEKNMCEILLATLALTE